MEIVKSPQRPKVVRKIKISSFRDGTNFNVREDVLVTDLVQDILTSKIGSEERIQIEEVQGISENAGTGNSVSKDLSPSGKDTKGIPGTLVPAQEITFPDISRTGIASDKMDDEGANLYSI